MAYTTIDDPTLYFNTILWTGDGTSSRSLTGVNFQPDWTWIKARTGSEGTQQHYLYDSVRGATKYLQSSTNNAEGTKSNGLSAFASDGFTIGDDNANNGSSTTYVAWNWLGANASSSNTDGSITSSVSANTTAGFSICKYTGVTGAQTFGHSLGAVPKMVIVKNLDSTENWRVYHHSITASKYLKLNTNDAETSDTGPFSGTTPTSTLVYVGGDAGTCENGSEHIAYCFAEKKGYSKFGSYEGTNSADGAFIYTGFSVAWVMIKNVDTSATAWVIQDSKRSGSSGGNPANKRLRANANNAEETDSPVDLLSNGFKIRSTGSFTSDANTYIYMAFAESPFVSSTGIPTTAR